MKKLSPSSIAVWFSFGDLGAGQRLGLLSAGSAASIRRPSSVVGHAAVAADDDRVDEAGLADELLRRRQVEQRQRCATR